jgi:hypothetical protein
VTYGRWSVIGVAEPYYHGRHEYRRMLCECACGTVRAVRLDKLRAGLSRSCGCTIPERAAETGRANLGRRFKHKRPRRRRSP